MEQQGGDEKLGGVRTGKAVREVTSAAIFHDGTEAAWEAIRELWSDIGADCSLGPDIGEFWYYGVPDNIPAGSWVTFDERGHPIWRDFDVEEPDGTAG